MIPQESGGQTVGILIDAEERVREVAIVKRSALLYLLVHQDVSARDADVLSTYARVIVAAHVRAPR